MPAPIALAPGERLLWQGAPAWHALARTLFHIRLVALYFLALTGLNAAIAWQDRPNLGASAEAVLPGVLLGAAALAILLALSVATARTTRYSLTDRRLVMQFGIALPATLTIPLPKVRASAVRVRRDHTGDIGLTLPPGAAPGYLKLWPHARPLRFRAPEPMLRDVPLVTTVAPLLARALAAEAERIRQEDAGEEEHTRAA